MSIIRLNNINKSYGANKILKDLSLDVEKGEMLAIMGESGKGKSTLLNIIGLIEKFDSGNLIIDGIDNLKPNSRVVPKLLREKIGYLFQNFALIDNKDVEENLLIALEYIKLSKKKKKEKVSEALKYVGLSGYENRKIYELSGGEQQRVAMARLVLKPCKVVLADEPTGSLDEKNRDIVLQLLKKLNIEGKTILIVTHDKEVASICSRIIKL